MNLWLEMETDEKGKERNKKDEFLPGSENIYLKFILMIS